MENKMFNDVWNPTTCEIVKWAYLDCPTPDQDWELALVDADLDLLMRLAMDYNCIKRIYFLNVLYMIVGDAFLQNDKKNINRVKLFLLRKLNDKILDINLIMWVQSSISLINGEMAYNYNEWCGMSKSFVNDYKIFLSTEGNDYGYTENLVAYLSDCHLEYECSPKNPVFGYDDRWKTWYSQGLANALNNSKYFIIILTDSWESSTWMGEESRVAKILRDQGSIKEMLYVDIRKHRESHIGIMSDYLITEISEKPDKILEYIVKSELKG